LCKVNFTKLMSVIDIILIIPILWFAYKGFSKGLVIEVISLLAFGLAIYAGINFTDYISGLIDDDQSNKYLPIISFSILFIGVLILVFMLGKIIERAVKSVRLEMINKIAGAVFGGAKIALIMSVLLVILRSYDEKLGFIPEKIKTDSLLFEPITKLSLLAIPSLKDSKLFDAPIPQVEIEPQVNVEVKVN
jgi:membrane protein required for colicin V production